MELTPRTKIAAVFTAGLALGAAATYLLAADHSFVYCFEDHILKASRCILVRP